MTDDKKQEPTPEEEEGIDKKEDAEGGEDEVGLDEAEPTPPVPPEEEDKWVGGHTMGGAHPTVPPPDKATL
jgi:hypothetical protein